MTMGLHCAMDECEYRLSKWMLQDGKDFDEEACWRRPKEHGAST